MNTYLHISSREFRFLLSLEQIVELFDADASSESLKSILSGNTGAVYWRDTLSCLLDIDELVGKQASKNNRCYVVCKSETEDQRYFILRVKNIHDLLHLEDTCLRELTIDSTALATMTKSVAIVPGKQELYFVLNNIQGIITAMHGDLDT
jgi:chemotaxis signal transduction protein